MGAGIGGLTAAALLARQGAKVLVVESHDRPGGSCTSWLRKARLPGGTAGRFIFDSGVQDFSGLGPGGALRWLLTELGLGSRLAWHRVRHRYHLDDLVIDVPATAEGFARKLAGMFPGEAGGLADFFRTISTIYKDLGDHGGAAPRHAANRRRTRAMGGTPPGIRPMDAIQFCRDARCLHGR